MRKNRAEKMRNNSVAAKYIVRNANSKQNKHMAEAMCLFCLERKKREEKEFETFVDSGCRPDGVILQDFRRKMLNNL